MLPRTCWELPQRSNMEWRPYNTKNFLNIAVFEFYFWPGQNQTWEKDQTWNAHWEGFTLSMEGHAHFQYHMSWSLTLAGYFVLQNICNDYLYICSQEQVFNYPTSVLGGGPSQCHGKSEVLTLLTLTLFSSRPWTHCDYLRVWEGHIRG